MLSIAKKRLLRKEYKKPLLSSFQNTKSTQTSGSVSADTIEQVKKTEFELELKKQYIVSWMFIVIILVF